MESSWYGGFRFSRRLFFSLIDVWEDMEERFNDPRAAFKRSRPTAAAQ